MRRARLARAARGWLAVGLRRGVTGASGRRAGCRLGERRDERRTLSYHYALAVHRAAVRVPIGSRVLS